MAKFQRLARGVPVPYFRAANPVAVASPRNGYSPTQQIPVSQRYRYAELAQKLEQEAWKDVEEIVPLNHWERRTAYPGSPVSFRTPLFDFWYDHLKEEGLPSGQVVSGAGGANPAAGTSPQVPIGWQNHIYDYTLIVATASASVSAATVTIVAGMNLQATDEPVTLSTITVTNDLAKADQSVILSGRVPMRFLQFRWSITFNTPGDTIDVIQQIAARST